MRVPYTFDVSVRYSTGWVPIDRLPAVEVPKKGERLVIDEGLAKRMFGEEFKEIASFYPVDLGKVYDICHGIDLSDKRSKTNIWTGIFDSALDKPHRFNEFVKRWNVSHLQNDPSLPNIRYNKHSPTYWYDLQVDVSREDEKYSKTIRNLPFEVEVMSGHSFNIHDDRGHTQWDIPIIVSEVKFVIPTGKKSNPVIHVDFVGVKKNIVRIKPKLQERQYERLDLFEKDWNTLSYKSKKDASVV